MTSIDKDLRLSKKQAEILKETFQVATLAGKNIFNSFFHLELQEIYQIIDGCTEKEFPRFLPNGFDVQIDYANDNRDSFIKIMMADDGFINYVKYLDAVQFRQLTDGCNKIVEWLNDKGGDYVGRDE